MAGVQHRHWGLAQQIITTVEDTYLSPIYDNHNGYNGTTLQDMLAYLFTAYGAIQEHDLVQNETVSAHCLTVLQRVHMR
jgi:hypothetical protein